MESGRGSLLPTTIRYGVTVNLVTVNTWGKKNDLHKEGG